MTTFTPPKPTINILGITPSNKGSTPSTFLGFIWGTSGGGKTTLAGTAPSDRLWLMFDPKGEDPLPNSGNIVWPLYTATPSITEEFTTLDRSGIKQLRAYLRENPNVNTVILDSITSFAELSLVYGITKAKTMKQHAKSDPCIEAPGYGGYGIRSAYTNAILRNLYSVCLHENRHLIIIGHEGVPDREEGSGTIIEQTIMLGGDLPQTTSKALGEVWYLEIDGLQNKRYIYIRPVRPRKPMKTHMFLSGGRAKFEWNYNAETKQGEGIADWYAAWQANNYEMIPLPPLNKAKT